MNVVIWSILSGSIALLLIVLMSLLISAWSFGSMNWPNWLVNMIDRYWNKSPVVTTGQNELWLSEQQLREQMTLTINEHRYAPFTVEALALNNGIQQPVADLTGGKDSQLTGQIGNIYGVYAQNLHDDLLKYDITVAGTLPQELPRGFYEKTYEHPKPRMYFDGGPRDGEYLPERTHVPYEGYELIGEQDGLYIYQYKG